jgi:hypothetical protein
MSSDNKKRVGFISTRLAGTDGVTLEMHKWENILTRLGCECFFFAGESEWPVEYSYVVEEAHFNHPDILALTADLFDNYKRSTETSGKVHALRLLLKEHLYKFIRKFGIELLIAENALSIPMNIPLGLALTELIAETNIPTIAHHHDFAWERSRFKMSAASDYQFGVFPPILPSVHHVVINSYASRQLALRTGSSSTLIPNVMDFDNPPGTPDSYADDLRSELGISTDEHLLLQPTRIVPRKRIELAIELTRLLGNQYSLVISHSSGDEGSNYETYLREYARLLNVKVNFAAERFNHKRGITSNGKKAYSLTDIYHHADMVTYPSNVEGFGNAFLESIYYRRPIVISTYEIFRIDIQPKGFEVIGFGDFIDAATVRQVEKWLQDPQLIAEVVEHNYELGKRFYSYRNLELHLTALLKASFGMNNS